ncbi:hypothetical protein NC652_036048 [Populus alba x Populus x berolinensis]|nr:hypothetical protein NC652_036048 [Populus alba x Populus x berolinensis]
MSTPSASWMQEFNEASKLGDEINGMISGKNSLPSSGPETQRHLSASRRKITILRTKLDILQSLLSELPSKQPITGKEMNRRQDMLKNLSTKVNQMASILNMSSSANRENLLGPDKKTDDIMNRATGLNNHEQDQGLEKLEETVISTKHIALAVNEELSLHTRLLDDLDEHVDATNSRLQEIGFSEQTHQGRLLLLDLAAHCREMASPSELWMREFNEASKLGDEISDMISGKNSLPQSGPETQRHLSAIRRKATILTTKLDSLQSFLSALPGKQPISGKEINRRQEMLKNLSTKVNQMSTALNMAGAANRENLLGSDSKTDNIINRASGLDNQGLVEQDEGLEKLDETVTSTKHIALAVNEELTLHTRLLDDLDEHVDVTNSRMQRVQRNLAFLNKRTKSGCACWIFLVIAIVILIVVVNSMLNNLILFWPCVRFCLDTLAWQKQTICAGLVSVLVIVNDDDKCTVMDACFLGKFNGFGITLGIGLRVSQPNRGAFSRASRWLKNWTVFVWWQIRIHGSHQRDPKSHKAFVL